MDLQPVWLTKANKMVGARIIEAAAAGMPYTLRTDDGETVQAMASDLKRMHRSTTEGLDDVIQLSELHEASLLHTLRVRYMQDKIYRRVAGVHAQTYAGTILIAVNPYADIRGMYTMEVARKYEKATLGDLPPHIFAIGNASYAALRRTGKNQIIVISGESGAGKTESTKLILQNFTAVSSQHSLIQEQIVEASPIMEAFGNAKTVRNDNSSRFGKFVEVQFGPDGTISGARILDYLLERSRIVHQALGERNYHVFYCLLAGSDPKTRAALRLLDATKFAYLNKSGCIQVPKIDDAADFEKVRSAMKLLKLGNHETVIFEVLSAVLHIGNLPFRKRENESPDGEACEISDKDAPRGAGLTGVEFVANLLGVAADRLARGLTTRTMTQRNETIASPLTAAQAKDSADALAKALYGRMFSWMLAWINAVLCSVNATSPFVGVLDIFGFEDFKENSFEQFCINYANERLQFYFNQHIFKLEQEEYEREGINWESIAFVDNQDCVDLISKKPTGMVWLIDEESNFPKGTDKSLMDKLSEIHAKNAFFVKPKRTDNNFGVRHYAGVVTYNIHGFLDKNRDTLRQEIMDTLATSKKTFVAALFSTDTHTSDDHAQLTLSRSFGGRRPGSKVPTIISQFHQSLTELLGTLEQCHPFFVRCIKPNVSKASREFSDDLILAQLRYLGMPETIRIRRLGYPVRFTFEEFYSRFRLLLPSASTTNATSPPRACRQIVES